MSNTLILRNWWRFWDLFHIISLKLMRSRVLVLKNSFSCDNDSDSACMTVTCDGNYESTTVLSDYWLFFVWNTPFWLLIYFIFFILEAMTTWCFFLDIKRQDILLGSLARLWASKQAYKTFGLLLIILIECMHVSFQNLTHKS